MIGQLYNEEVREHKLHLIVLLLQERFSVCRIVNRTGSLSDWKIYL